jgi:hypothetical protein
VPPTNAAPVADAGADLDLPLGAAATLAGAVSDDGAPVGTLTAAWSVVSGPGAVAFADAGSAATTATFAAAGAYVLRLTASDGALSASDEVGVTVTAATPGGDGLAATYFDTAGFSGVRVERIDPTVDFDWGTGSPDPAIAGDTFSARWTGWIEPQYSEVYTFTTRSDDGVRLWVAGKRVVRNWTDHPPTENSGAIFLQAGVRVPIRLEFYERTGGATMRLFWSSGSQPRQVVPRARLYSSDAAAAPVGNG